MWRAFHVKQFGISVYIARIIPKIAVIGALNCVAGVQNVMSRCLFSKIGANNDEIGVIFSVAGVWNTDTGVPESKKSGFGTSSPGFFALTPTFFTLIFELFASTMQF